MKKDSVNVICHANKGRFEFRYRPPASKDFKKKIISNSGDLFNNIKTAILSILKEYDIQMFLYSSSMDFPEEDGCTVKQVQEFEEALAKLIGERE